MDFMGCGRMVDLSKIGNRERLKPKAGDEPHWHRLRAGCFVGYRPPKRGGRGNWFARAYDTDKVGYTRKPLGNYGDLTGHEVFAAARKDAEAWAELVESGGILAEKIDTVEDACRSYLRAKPGPIAEGVFRRHVFEDPIAKLRLDQLRRRHLREWRKRLETAPAMVSRSKVGDKRTKPRALSTVNRDMVPLRAALGRVMPLGTPNTDAAWQEALKPIKGADRQRDLYLDRDQRRKLLDAAEPELAPFLHALCLLPLRPGALAGLRAGDFDKRTHSLLIGRDKNGRARKITVPATIAEFLSVEAGKRRASEPLFARRDGRAWDKDSWKHPIKRAVDTAELPSATTAYTLRHSVLTDLVRVGLPILTVAQMAGTSVAMIERHYGHLVRDDAEQALARIAI
jgi:integrase